MDNSDILDLIAKRKSIIEKSNLAEQEFFSKVKQESKDFFDLLKQLQMQQIQINTNMYDVFCNQFIRFDGSLTLLFTLNEGGKILVRDVTVSMLPEEPKPTSSRKKKKEVPLPKKEPFVEASIETFKKLPDESKKGFLDILSKVIKNKEFFLTLERNTIKEFYESQVESQSGQLQNWKERLDFIK